MWRSLSTLHALLHMWVEKLQRVKYTSERNWLFDSCSHVIGMIIQLWRWKDSEITSCCQSTYSGNPFYKVPGRGSQPPRDRSSILSETALSLTPTDLNDVLGQPSEIPGTLRAPIISPGISHPQALTGWMWVWVNSGSWWWTGRPGVLRFMGSQRVGHDWATELNWTCRKIILRYWRDWNGKVRSSVKTSIPCISDVIRKSIKGNYKVEDL